MQLIQELLTADAVASVRTKFNNILLEDVNKHILSAVAALKADAPEKGDTLRGVNLDTLALLITGLKIITKSEYRSALTSDDVGINPNNAKELLGLLDTVPNGPKEKLSGNAAKFFTAVSSLSKSLLEKTKELVKQAISTNQTERDAALKELTIFASKVDQMVAKLRTVK